MKGLTKNLVRLIYFKGCEYDFALHIKIQPLTKHFINQIQHFPTHFSTKFCCGNMIHNILYNNKMYIFIYILDFNDLLKIII